MAYAPVPATNTSGSTILSHAQAYWLQRTALETLRPNFLFYGLCEPDFIPLQQGKTITWWRNLNLGAATAGVQEGIVGTSLGMAPTKTVSATLSQYADFMSTSDVMKDTFVTPIMTKMADDMGFRAAYTLDNVTRSIIDAESGNVRSMFGTYTSAKEFRASSFLLQGKNVPARTNGLFDAVIHPYVAFDLVNDPSVNGLADIFKYTSPGTFDGSTKIASRESITEVGGCRIAKSTNVKTTSGSPNKWRCYVVGRQAIGVSSLTGYQPSNVTDPNKQRFKVMTWNAKGIDVANPTGQIGAIVSYNFMHTTKVLEGGGNIGGAYRYDMFDSPSSIVA